MSTLGDLGLSFMEPFLNDIGSGLGSLFGVNDTAPAAASSTAASTSTSQPFSWGSLIAPLTQAATTAIPAYYMNQQSQQNTANQLQYSYAALAQQRELEQQKMAQAQALAAMQANAQAAIAQRQILENAFGTAIAGTLRGSEGTANALQTLGTMVQRPLLRSR